MSNMIFCYFLLAIFCQLSGVEGAPHYHLKGLKTRAIPGVGGVPTGVVTFTISEKKIILKTGIRWSKNLRIPIGIRIRDTPNFAYPYLTYPYFLVHCF